MDIRVTLPDDFEHRQRRKVRVGSKSSGPPVGRGSGASVVSRPHASQTRS